MQPPQSIEEIKAGLETTEKGGVRQSIRNCLTVFQRDPCLLYTSQRENETAQQKALEKYSELDTPFYLHSGISKDAFDYIEFYILFLAILCVAIAAPTFAGEYQTGGDSILRTTKYGHKQLAITKILVAFTLFVVTFLVGITVHTVSYTHLDVYKRQVKGWRETRGYH